MYLTATQDSLESIVQEQAIEEAKNVIHDHNNKINKL